MIVGAWRTRTVCEESEQNNHRAAFHGTARDQDHFVSHEKYGVLFKATEAQLAVAFVGENASITSVSNSLIAGTAFTSECTSPEWGKEFSCLPAGMESR